MVLGLPLTTNYVQTVYYRVVPEENMRPKSFNDPSSNRVFHKSLENTAPKP